VNEASSTSGSGAYLQRVPIAIVMLSFNEAHNMEAVLRNLRDWAQEIFLVDSYSTDDTVDVALRHDVHVVQRKFNGFGDQWNFALRELPIKAPWTMKLDPDERLTDRLKANIAEKLAQTSATGIAFDRRLWFMGKPLPIKQEIVRIWKTGSCRFTDVTVNEHPIVDGKIDRAEGVLEHHDSPDLHHWIDKQNRYTSAEALSLYFGKSLAATPRLLGSRIQRRMWFKKNFMRIPFRYAMTWVVNLVQVRVWRSGKTGFAWARLRVWARRMKEDKIDEMRYSGRPICVPRQLCGQPHPGAIQAERHGTDES
jgi:glycosyltransferase involved in cell wall biosynthesis